MTKPDNVPNDFYWDDEFEVFRNEKGSKAYNSEGKFLAGFANPIFKHQHQNKSGRPTGGRNKSALERAQSLIDDSAEQSVRNLLLIGSNSWRELGLTGPIPAATMVNANNKILEKAIAQEKEKLKEEQQTEESWEEIASGGGREDTPGAVVDFSSRKR